MPQTQSQSVTHNHKAFLETTAPNFIRRQFFGAKFLAPFFFGGEPILFWPYMYLAAKFFAPLIFRKIF
jgi:hypothetical protein